MLNFHPHQCLGDDLTSPYLPTLVDISLLLVACVENIRASLRKFGKLRKQCLFICGIQCCCHERESPVSESLTAHPATCFVPPGISLGSIENISV